jgi:hypothetical protein
MMVSLDVARDEWAEFLDSFSRQHRAWLATVERPASGSFSDPRPLVAVVPRQDGDGVTAIEIAFGESHGDIVRVDNPIQIRVRKTDDGADRGLDIVDDHGMCTQVRFRAAAVPEMVDGVAPGQL